MPKLRSPTLPEGMEWSAKHTREAEPAGWVVMVISPGIEAAGEWDGGVCNSQGRLLAGQNLLDGNR